MGDIRVMVVDDHRVFTELLGFALDAQPGIRCIARARTARAAVELAASAEFDAAIVDVQLPDGDGISLATTLRARHPAARFVVLTAFPTPALIAQAGEAGFPLLAKDGSLDAVLREIRAAPASDSTPPTLTAREREVLELLAEGLDVHGIARGLAISVHTARGYVKSLLHKTGTRSQLEAVAAARRSGLLDAFADA